MIVLLYPLGQVQPVGTSVPVEPAGQAAAPARLQDYEAVWRAGAYGARVPFGTAIQNDPNTCEIWVAGVR